MSERLLFSKTLTGAQPKYVDYTPTYSAFTLGNGTATFKYARIGQFCHLYGQITFGSTSSISGNFTINLPFSCANEISGTSNCNGLLEDSGVAAYQAAFYFTGAGFFVGALGVGGTYATHAIANATVPFTWGTNDVVRVNLVYKVANG